MKTILVIDVPEKQYTEYIWLGGKWHILGKFGEEE